MDGWSESKSGSESDKIRRAEKYLMLTKMLVVEPPFRMFCIFVVAAAAACWFIVGGGTGIFIYNIFTSFFRSFFRHWFQWWSRDLHSNSTLWLSESKSEYAKEMFTNANIDIIHVDSSSLNEWWINELSSNESLYQME